MSLICFQHTNGLCDGKGRKEKLERLKTEQNADSAGLADAEKMRMLRQTSPSKEPGAHARGASLLAQLGCRASPSCLNSLDLYNSTQQ